MYSVNCALYATNLLIWNSMLYILLIKSIQFYMRHTLKMQNRRIKNTSLHQFASIKTQNPFQLEKLNRNLTNANFLFIIHCVYFTLWDGSFVPTDITVENLKLREVEILYYDFKYICL